MNVRSEPEVRLALDPGEPACSLMSKVTCEIPKTQNRGTTRSSEYQDFGYREMEMSKTLTNRSPEIAKCEMAK
jgi:hypothetical protein